MKSAAVGGRDPAYCRAMTDGTAVQDLTSRVEEVASRTAFSGVVRVDEVDGTTFERVFGWADRRWQVPFQPDTRAAIASGTKGFTALATMAVIEAGDLDLDTTARSLLGRDLPLVDDAVTIEHLLAHRSGIGDYLDEDTIADSSDYVMSVPVQQLDDAESYLAVLDGHAQVSAPGDVFAYNNGGFVVLALCLERAAGEPYDQLVERLVCRPAALDDTTFVRSDALSGNIATGYLDATGLRTNVLHMPLVGVGDGGLYTTAADIRRFWAMLFSGGIVRPDTVEAMVHPRSRTASGNHRYGLGFWLAADGPVVQFEGADAGVSFRSTHDPTTSRTSTVIANTSDGAWPMARVLDGRDDDAPVTRSFPESG
ncbi:serine hydrolase domain-containing protein [soil metagenome]